MKLPPFNINLVTVYKFVRSLIRRKKSPVKRAFKLLRDKYDERDHIYSLHREAAAIYPASTNRKNISEFPWRYDQETLGACVGFGMITGFRRTLQVNKMKDFSPAALFAYFIARRNKKRDTGASIRDAIKAFMDFGVCSELTWPFKVCKFAKTPPPEAFVEALDHQLKKYERIPYTDKKGAIMHALSSGYPIVFGMQVYESFMSDEVARTGLVPIPDKRTERCYGGHCMVAFDYNENNVIVLNSWKDWGINQTCEIPWELFLSDADVYDMWVLYLTE